MGCRDGSCGRGMGCRDGSCGRGAGCGCSVGSDCGSRCGSSRGGSRRRRRGHCRGRCRDGRRHTAGGQERQHAQARHDEARVFVGRQGELLPAVDRHGVKELDLVGLQGLGQGLDLGRQRIVALARRAQALGDGDPGQQHREIGKCGLVGQPARRQVVGHRQDAGCVTRRERAQQRHQVVLVERAQHVARRRAGELARTE